MANASGLHSSHGCMIPERYIFLFYSYVVFLELYHILPTSADSNSVLLKWLSAGWIYVPQVQIVSCGLKLCSVWKTAVLQDQIIFYKLEFCLTVLYF